MKRCLAFLIITGTGFLSQTLAAAENSNDGQQLAEAVWAASGGRDWNEVKTIDFTFAVEKNGKTIAKAQHHWDVAAQTDQVKWKGKNVTVNLANPARDQNAKAAYARWVNDSYWLLAPLKLRDRGVTVTSEGTKEVNGAKREVLHLNFEQVGLTPTDQYRLYIDPESKLVMSWDYIPKDGKGMSGSWEDYKKTGGLTLATNHKMEGGVQIRMLDLKVTAAK